VGGEPRSEPDDRRLPRSRMQGHGDHGGEGHGGLVGCVGFPSRIMMAASVLPLVLIAKEPSLFSRRLTVAVFPSLW